MNGKAFSMRKRLTLICEDYNNFFKIFEKNLHGFLS